MKAIFFGTPKFALPCLDALLRSEIDVPLICTRPPRRVGRRRAIQETPIGSAGTELGIRTLSPDRLDSDTVSEIAKVDAEVIVVAAYGRFIPKELLAMPRLGVVNVHPSILPRHRGPSPVATTILEGDEFTGVTIMQLDEGMDTGPILARSPKIAVDLQIRVDELTERLFVIGSEILTETLTKLDSGEIEPEIQDDRLATVTQLIRKSDGEVDWSLNAERISRMNRAYHPWPGTFTTWRHQNLKLIKLSVAGNVSRYGNVAAGLVYSNSEREFLVGTGDGALIRVEELQLEGRRALSADEFLRGHPEIEGEALGS